VGRRLRRAVRIGAENNTPECFGKRYFAFASCGNAFFSSVSSSPRRHRAARGRARAAGAPRFTVQNAR
jgi:hypothetical protein